MRIGFTVAAVALLCSVEPLRAQQADAAKDFYGLTKMHTVRVSVSAADYGKMDPPPSRGPFGGGARPGGGGNRPALGSNDFGAGNFGFEFTPETTAAMALNSHHVRPTGMHSLNCVPET